MTRAESLQAAIDGKAKPLGSLGRIEELAVLLGCLQDTDQPAVTDPVLLVFAGDQGRHGIGSALRPPARRPHVTHGRQAGAGSWWQRLFGA